MKFNDIKKFPNIHYRVDIPLDYVAQTIEDYIKEGLIMDPDFQRGYVWTNQQKVLYVEYLLKEPVSGREIYFNHPGWMGNWKGEFVLVDGKQRLNAWMEFWTGKIKAYGHYRNEYEGRMPTAFGFSFNIAKLQTRKEVLEWYLDFNTGGTYHTESEIQKVKELILKEK